MQINVASIMTRQTISARPDSTVAEIAKLLTDHDISAVPVCAEDGALLGMISEGDLVRPFREEHSLRSAWWLGVLSRGKTLAQKLADYIQTDQRCARDLMTHAVITTSETTTPAEIADLLLRHRIKRVPVVRNGQLVGIVSRADLVRALSVWRDTLGEREWQPSPGGSDHPLIVSAARGQN